MSAEPVPQYQPHYPPPYGPPPQPQHFQPYGPYPQQQPRNGVGTAGMVLGIVGLALSFLPFIGWLAIIVALVGLPLSGVGYSRVKKGEATNKGQAVAGLVCTIITVAVSIIGMMILASMAASI